MAKSDNPLLGKHIPPPPAAVEHAIGSSTEAQESIRGKEHSGITGHREERERATVEVSVYLRPSQDDKLEELRLAYKRRMKKKISANEVIRRLIEQATLEQIL